MPLFSANDAIGAVTRDLIDGFEGVFQPMGDLVAVGLFADKAVGTVDTDELSVVAWELLVRQSGPIQGTPATNKTVTMRGMTVIDGTGSELMFSRYIDWMALYADLGALAIARPPVEDRYTIHDNVPFPIEGEEEQDPDA